MSIQQGEKIHINIASQKVVLPYINPDLTHRFLLPLTGSKEEKGNLK
jgi:hypothetical protein